MKNLECDYGKILKFFRIFPKFFEKIIEEKQENFKNIWRNFDIILRKF